MKDDQLCLFSGRRYKEVRHLAAPRTTCRQHPLYLPSPLYVGSGGLHQGEDREIIHVLIPLSGVAASVADFEVRNARPSESTGVGKRLNDPTDRHLS